MTQKYRNRIVEVLKDYPVDKIEPCPWNWREHPPAQAEALRHSFDQLGIITAVLARRRPDGTLEALDGHLRKQELSGHKMTVLVTDLKTEEEAKQALLSIDPISAMAEANKEKLAELRDQIAKQGPELRKRLEQMASIEKEQPADAKPQIDRAAELQKKWQTAQGQLWLIGSHRLLCGDSTKREDVERVMGGERAGLMNTDPPYGVAYANDDRPNPGVAKPRVANDEMTDERLQEFLESAFKSAVDAALKEDAAWYMWHAHLTQGYFAAAAAAAAANVVLHRQIIWVKPVLLLGRGHYHWKHEPCFMGWVKSHQPPDYGEGNGERTQTTVWEVDSVTQADRKEFNHSTPKPTGLFTIPIVKHLKPGEIAYEPFAGSGPQFVAAENLHRRCYGIEISPAYCAVILERMKTAFPTLEIRQDKPAKPKPKPPNSARKAKKR